MGVLRTLTSRGTEYCGKTETHDQLYRAVNNIEHTKTKVMHPQTGLHDRVQLKGSWRDDFRP